MPRLGNSSICDFMRSTLSNWICFHFYFDSSSWNAVAKGKDDVYWHFSKGFKFEILSKCRNWFFCYLTNVGQSVWNNLVPPIPWWIGVQTTTVVEGKNLDVIRPLLSLSYFIEKESEFNGRGTCSTHHCAHTFSHISWWLESEWDKTMQVCYVIPSGNRCWHVSQWWKHRASPLSAAAQSSLLMSAAKRALYYHFILPGFDHVTLLLRDCISSESKTVVTHPPTGAQRLPTD